MQELFGCDLHGVLFEEVDQSLVNRITRLVEDSILYHEPRIRLDRLTVTESPTGSVGALSHHEYQGAAVWISIQYTVRGTNSRYNMVYPFYLEEAALPGLAL